MYNVDDVGIEFSAKNSQKNNLMGIFAPISTFRQIGDQNFNSIRYLAVDSFGFRMPISYVDHYLMIFTVQATGIAALTTRV